MPSSAPTRSPARRTPTPPTSPVPLRSCASSAPSTSGTSHGPPLSPAIRHLLLCEFLTLCAGSVGQSATLWWLARHDGAAGLTRYSAWIALTALVALPLLSPLGDRVARGRLMLRGQSLLMLTTIALCALLPMGLLNLWTLSLCGVVSALALAVVQPAQSSVLLDLVTAADLPRAIRLRRGTQAVGSLCGPALGGIAMTVGGSSAVSAASSVSWAFALQLLLAGAAALAALPLRHQGVVARRPTPRRWTDDLLAGLRAKWLVRLDRWWSLTGALMMVFFLPATGMLLPLRLQSLGASAVWYGLCGSALSMGVLVGVLGVADGVMKRLGRPGAMGLAITVCGGCLGAIALTDQPVGLALLFALIGLCLSVTQLMGQTHRALAVPEDFRARLAAAQLTLSHLASTCAPLLAGALLQRWPVAQVYGLMAAGFLISGLALFLVPDLRTFLRLPPADAQGWYERRYPAAFRRSASASTSTSTSTGSGSEAPQQPVAVR